MDETLEGGLSSTRSDLQRTVSETRSASISHDHGARLPNSRHPRNWAGWTWCNEPAVEEEARSEAVDGTGVSLAICPAAMGRNSRWRVGAQEARRTSGAELSPEVMHKVIHMLNHSS